MKISIGNMTRKPNAATPDNSASRKTTRMKAVFGPKITVRHFSREGSFDKKDFVGRDRPIAEPQPAKLPSRSVATFVPSAGWATLRFYSFVNA